MYALQPESTSFEEAYYERKKKEKKPRSEAKWGKKCLNQEGLLFKKGVINQREAETDGRGNNSEIYVGQQIAMGRKGGDAKAAKIEGCR